MNEILRRILFLPPQSSTVAAEIDHLHFFVILTTMFGALLVTIIGGWFVIRYRRRDHAEAQPHPTAGEAKSTTKATLEVVSVVVLAVLFLVWWSIGIRQFTRLRVAPEGAMDVYVTGKQWMWKFAYPQGNHSISDLVVPAGRPVRLVLTSRDVIHSFFVPDFRVKEDAVPGRYTTLWFEAKSPGTHDVFCSQYCGTGHSTMRGQVIVLAPADFERWLAGERSERLAAEERAVREDEGDGDHPDDDHGHETDLVRVGERVAAEQGCLRCHSIDGTPHIGPTWAGMFGAEVSLKDGGHVRADETYITESMMDPRAKIHLGFDDVMPSYQGRIRPGDVGALLEFIKSLRDVRPDGKTRDHAAAKMIEDAGVPDAGSEP